MTARLLQGRQRGHIRIDRTALLKGVWARSILKPRRSEDPRAALPVRHSRSSSAAQHHRNDLDSGEELVSAPAGTTSPCSMPYAPAARGRVLSAVSAGGRRCADGGSAKWYRSRWRALSRRSGRGGGCGFGGSTWARPSDAARPRCSSSWRLTTRADGQQLRAHARALAATPDRPPLLWIRPRVRLNETFATDQLQWYLEEGERAAIIALAARRP